MTGPFIYFIQAKGDGPIKIGFTANDPRKRMVKIQSDCPWQVDLLGAIRGTVAQEKQLHLVLMRWRTQGEWFEPHPIVIAAVTEAIRCGNEVAFRKTPKRPKHDHPLCLYRAARSLTLRDLANQTGITFSILARFESGKRRPSVHDVRTLQSVTGISPALLRPDLAKMFGSAA